MRSNVLNHKRNYFACGLFLTVTPFASTILVGLHLKESVMVTKSNNVEDTDSRKFFEYWSSLFKTDPVRFEEERKAQIEKVITSASPARQERLRQLQLSIDEERRRATNPIDGMLRLSKMMLQQSLAKDGTLILVHHLGRLDKYLRELDKTSVREKI